VYRHVYDATAPLVNNSLEISAESDGENKMKIGQHLPKLLAIK